MSFNTGDKVLVDQGEFCAEPGTIIAVLTEEVPNVRLGEYKVYMENYRLYARILGHNIHLPKEGEWVITNTDEPKFEARNNVMITGGNNQGQVGVITDFVGLMTFGSTTASDHKAYGYMVETKDHPQTVCIEEKNLSLLQFSPGVFKETVKILNESNENEEVADTPKFKKGDRVHVTSGFGHDRYGVIQESIGRSYHVRLDDENRDRIYFERNLEFEDSSKNIVEDFLEMATVKWGFNGIKLAIYGDEGEGYPHFHFYKGLKPEGGIPKEFRNGGGCLCIESPAYFIHGKHTETLTPKEIRGLIKFLNENNHSIPKYTNWEYIIFQWNDNNPELKQLSMSLPIPEYKSDMETIQE